MMSDSRNQPPVPSSWSDADDHLDSWKEIASYLQRTLATVRRWEKEEGLPVHRHVHNERSTVYAYRSEIDAWVGSRSSALGNDRPDGFRSFSDNRKTVVGVAGGVTLFLLVGLVAWIDIGSSPNPEGLSFQERDWVLITDFENRTGEAVFDGVLESTLHWEIANSQFVNVVPRERINDTLQLMRKPVDTPIDSEVAREVSLRDGGIKALLTGGVEKVDSTYLLSVELVDPSTGQTIAAISKEAAGQSEVLTALRVLSSWSRETLGEKLTDIRDSEEQLERVTTPSLRALQLFTKADALISQRQADVAEELLKQAVAIDPEFASAHIFLAHAIRNQRKPAEEFLKHAEQAFQLAGTTSDRERYFIHGSYYQMNGEQERAVQAYETLLSLHPDHFWAVNNLANQFEAIGQEQRALPYHLRRADLRPNSFLVNFNAVQWLLRGDHNLVRAKPYIERARKLISTEMIQTANDARVLKIMLLPAYEAWFEGDLELALVEIEKVLQTLKSAGISGKAAPHLGRLYGALGKRQLAREWMTKGLERRNRHWILARIAHDEGDHEAMKDHIKQYLESTKVSRPRPQPSAMAAILLARAGFLAESEKMVIELEKRGVPSWLKRKSAQQFDSAQVEMARGVLKLSQGNTSEGIAILEGTLPLVRDNYEFKDFEILAEAYTRQGNWVAAIQLLKQASEREPIYFRFGAAPLWLRFRWRLASLYHQTGRAEDAREIEDELRRLLALADSDHPILRQLDRTKELASLESER